MEGTTLLLAASQQSEACDFVDFLDEVALAMELQPQIDFSPSVQVRHLVNADAEGVSLVVRLALEVHEVVHLLEAVVP